MGQYDLDYDLLNKFSKKTYKLSDVKHQLIRVAADLVRFRDAPKDELWEVISDGEEGDYIVARYDAEEEGAAKVASAAFRSPWEAVVQSDSKEVQLFYKGASFTKFKHSDAETIKDFLPTKLASDKQYVSALINSLPVAKKAEVQKLYPELF